MLFIYGRSQECSLSSSVLYSLVTLDTSLAPVQFSLDPEKRSSNPAVACSSRNRLHRLHHEELSRNVNIINTT